MRDRAHAAAARPSAGDAVWTERELFERLAAWAAFRGGYLRDERAPLWSIARALARGSGLSARIAHDAADLLRALVHGGGDPSAIAAGLAQQGALELRGLFGALAEAERELARLGRVDNARGLALAVAALEQRRECPAVLRAFSQVCVLDLVEPSDLELRALVALARAGVPLLARVPVDGAGRGLLAGVEPVLRALEAAHDADALELELDDVSEAPHGTAPALAAFARAFYGGTTARDAPVEIALCADEADEARAVASVVAAWRRAGTSSSSSSSSSSLSVPRIAVAVRTVDEGAARIADALHAQGVPFHLQRRPLAATAAARLVLDVLALARDGAPRDRMLAVLSSPALAHHVSSEEGARVLRVLRLAAARSDVESGFGDGRGGYRHRLQRYRAGLAGGDRDDVDFTLLSIERALSLAHALPQEAPLAEHLRALTSLLTRLFRLDASVDTTDLGRADVREILDDAHAASALQHDVALVPIAAFATLVQRLFERAQAPPLSVHDASAVEILSLPELWGRAFDHVVVAGCVEGRLPKSERTERLLADTDRALINRAAGKRVLRLLDDDPLEPSPVPRAQALETLWMLGALRAPSSSLLLTAPARDGRGRELSPSVFLLECARALGDGGVHFAREPSPRSRTVQIASLRARSLLHDDVAAAHGIEPSLLARADLATTLARQRSRFFALKKRVALAEIKAPYAFAVDERRMQNAFAASFGLSAERPLTPTRLEALAECRVHGFLQHVLKVDVDPPAGNAADARVLGTLAHTAMERFFRERKAGNVPASRITPADRARVRALVVEEANAVVATGHLAAIRAQVAWLETALVRAVSMLARAPLVASVEPHDFEVRIGVGDQSAPQEAAAFGAAPIEAHGRRLWLGGVIDRIDEGPTARAVIDYKTSSTGTIRRKAHRDVLFEKHFQLLLYLRLLEHHRPTPPHARLHGYLISLRDGTTSADVAEVPDLRARIVDDTRADGLAAGVARVILPILDGALPPDAGDRCEDCRLQRFCRVPLAAEFAPDLDDVDESADP
ncbi:MAG TPA: PD-(D/E)XK nuclease family protein [Byssovorax sp.]